jgi:HAD superfamily hydrolase (TIGR01549 family)
MDVKGVFFDLYGTLMIYGDMERAWEDWFSSIHQCLVKHGFDNSKDFLSQKLNGFFENASPEGDSELSIYERMMKNLTNDLGLNLDKEAINETCLSGLYAWHIYVSLDPDVIPVLKTLKKSKKLALISNFDHPPHVHSLLSNLGLTRYFESIVISGEVGIKKPNPKIFSYALKDTGLGPEEVCYVGDSPEDVRGARAADIYPILIQRNKEDQKIISDYNAEALYAEKNSDNELFRDVIKISKLTDLIKLV